MKKTFFLNPIFCVALLCLLLNDFILKERFGNFFTGKLSDLAGIIVFTLFLSAFFSRNKTFLYFSIAVFFAFWKSPLSSTTIEFINQFSNLNYERIVDYTDLFCLLILVPLYFYQPNIRSDSPSNKLAFNVLFGISVFGMVATSRGNMRDYGYVYVGEEMTLKTTKTDFLALLNERNIQYKFVSKTIDKRDTIENYDLQKFTINSDTIYNASISLRQKNENKLELNIHHIYITEKGKPIVTRDYSKADSIEKVYKHHTIDYFKNLNAKSN